MSSYLLGEYLWLYIRKKMFDREYIGCYEDQKTYSYWDSGFVGPIYIYETRTKKIMCFYTLQLQHHKLGLILRKYELLSIKRVKPKIKYYVFMILSCHVCVSE